jgi:hypothetical protein
MYELDESPLIYSIIDGEVETIADKAYCELGEQEEWLVYRRTLFRNGIHVMQFDFIR